MLLGTPGASLLGNILTGQGINRAREKVIRAAYGNKRQITNKKKNGFLMLPHPLTNSEVQKYCQSEPRFNVIYSRDNLPKPSSAEVKDGAYIINLDEYSDIGSHWVALYVQNNDVINFDSFRAEYIPKKN